MLHSKRLLILGICFSCPAFAQSHDAASSAATADTSSDAQISAWIEDLESNTYTTRVQATEQLIAAGHAAVEPVSQAAERGGLETIARSIYILRQLALTDENHTAQTGAYDALTRIAERRFTGAARRANAALTTVHEVRKQTAQRKLAKLGAVFATTRVMMIRQIPPTYQSVTIGKAWRGSQDDLAQLTWVTKHNGDGPAIPWMIVLDGDQVTDSWIDSLSGIENLVAVKIRSAKITNDGIERMAQLQHLQLVELLYNDVTDEAFDSLAKMANVSRFRLIGNRMTHAGNDVFKQAVGPAEVDFRQGGFLGVGCASNPCRVQQVQAKSAAAAAGFRIGDIITKYDGQPVETMEDLMKLIAAHSAGDQVTVELQRGDQQLVKTITLGRWD